MVDGVKDWFATGAAAYDESESFMFEPATIERTVDVLQELAGEGRVLELAIGTGRVGLPLARRGVEVHGIDLSGPMVEQLRAKPGGAEIPVTIGDMTCVRADGAVRLV
jgi:ubiquinone/menaquinone biosynthesis C-methylase UbiE